MAFIGIGNNIQDGLFRTLDDPGALSSVNQLGQKYRLTKSPARANARSFGFSGFTKSSRRISWRNENLLFLV